MILYRAISKNDIKSIDNEGYILCTLLNSLKTSDILKKQEYTDAFNKYIKDVRGNSLDGMIGHITGVKLKVNRSPWISTTTNLDFVISEYAIPQSGKYNMETSRKPVAIIDMEDNLVYSNSEDIKDLRNTKKDEFAIDLRNNNLARLYNSEIITNEVSIDFHIENGKIERNKITGFANYATASDEILVYKSIPKNKIKYIMYPFMQDIIYASGFDVTKNYDFFVKNEKQIETWFNNVTSRLGSEKELFNLLYPSYKEGNNLTDILIAIYNKDKYRSIEECYNILKQQKMDLLKKIIPLFNFSFGLNLKPTRLVDNGILVKNYDNFTKEDKIRVNDVVVIEKDGIIYKYNPEVFQYQPLSDGIPFGKAEIKKRS